MGIHNSLATFSRSPRIRTTSQEPSISSPRLRAPFGILDFLLIGCYKKLDRLSKHLAQPWQALGLKLVSPSTVQWKLLRLATICSSSPSLKALKAPDLCSPTASSQRRHELHGLPEEHHRSSSRRRISSAGFAWRW